MTDGQKEKIKLRANYWNAIAVSVFAVGGLSPVIALSLNRPKQAFMSLFIFAAAVIASYIIHTIAKSIVKSIDD